MRNSARKISLRAIQAFTARIQLKGMARALWAIHAFLQDKQSTYPIRNGLVLNIDNAQLYQWWNVINYGGYETVLLLERLLRPGDAYVDAGANIGYMSINAAKIIGPRGKVLAIEPEPRARVRLSHNVQINDLHNIEIVPMALSDHNGTAVFSVATADGLSRLDNGREHNPCMVLLQKIEVPTATLDGVIEQSLGERPIRFLKMDIEGSEYTVLSAAPNLLSRGETIILFESNPDALAQNGVSLIDIHQLLLKNAYETFIIESHAADWCRLGRIPTLRPVVDVTTDALLGVDCLAVPTSLRHTVDDMIVRG